jgi:hypothetical protein
MFGFVTQRSELNAGESTHWPDCVQPPPSGHANGAQNPVGGAGGGVGGVGAPATQRTVASLAHAHGHCAPLEHSVKMLVTQRVPEKPKTAVHVPGTQAPPDGHTTLLPAPQPPPPLSEHGLEGCAAQAHGQSASVTQTVDVDAWQRVPDRN